MDITWEYSGRFLRDEAQKECDKIARKSDTVEEAWKKVEKTKWKEQILENVTFLHN